MLSAITGVPSGHPVIQSSSHPTSTVRDWLALLKPGVMSLVVFTGAVGMLMAPGAIHPLLALITICCIALGSGAGAAINMWYDRDIDSIMKRTARRPLPTGRIHPDDALAFGLFLAVFAVMLLGLATNWVAGGILAFAIFFYAVIYTMWLKRSTSQNIVIGGAAGAFPPVIGWASVTGDISLMPLILFSIIFLWTPPHFWALALYRNEDYRNANIPMLPVTSGRRVTQNHMLVYTLVLMLCAVTPFMLHQAGIFYLIATITLNARFCLYAWQVRASDSDAKARKMFGFSIFYLFALFAALLIDHWFFTLT